MSVAARSIWRTVLVRRWHMLQQHVSTYSVPLLVALFVATALASTQAALLTSRHAPLSLVAAAREARFLVSGVYDLEADQRGDFRWLTGESTFALSQLGRGSATVLSLRFGPPPPALIATTARITVGQQIAAWPIDERPRTYYLLVPASTGRDAPISVQSASLVIPPDVRPVGLRFEAIAVAAVGAGVVWPVGAQVFAQTALLLVGALLFVQLGVPNRAVGGGTIVLGILLGCAFVLLPLLYAPYVARLTLALGLLLAATYALLPVVLQVAAPLGSPQTLRVLWGITLLACAIRLVGALYPLFRAYDLPLNVERLHNVAGGSLVALHRSFEFHGGETVYPPGPYLVLLPGLLVGIAPPLLVQVGIALIDGFSVLGIAALARALGLNARAMIVATLLAVAMPISLTSLYYGHTAQIFGQALMAPLALLVLRAFERGRGRYWVGAGVVLSVALLTHIGVSILAASWLGIVWLITTARRALPGPSWRRFTAMLITSGMIAMLCVYAPVIAQHIAQLQQIGAQAAEGSNQPAYNLIARAYWISYTPVALLLAIPGLVLLIRFLQPHPRLVVGGWLAAVALFAGVELITGLQVRFLVFMMPLVAISVAQLTEHIPGPPVLRPALTGALLAAVIVQGCQIWYTGAFQNIAPSMVPLLR